MRYRLRKEIKCKICPKIFRPWKKQQITCSRECGAAHRWKTLEEKGDIKRLNNLLRAGQKSSRLRLMRERFLKACEDSGFNPTEEFKEFYVRAYQRGYLSGYATRGKRLR